MSYPAEDRHERDVVGGPARNPSQDMEKHDKSKVLSANPGGILFRFYSLPFIFSSFSLVIKSSSIEPFARQIIY